MVLVSQKVCTSAEHTVAPYRCTNCGQECDTIIRKDFNNQVRQCQACGALEFIKQNTPPLEEIYSRDYFHGEEYVDYNSYTPSHRKNFRKKINLLCKHSRLPEHLRVLEVGAATGEFYQALIRHPRIQLESYLGLEISEYARQEANSRGVRVISPLAATSQQEIAELRPNLIVAWDVWEHLEDPVAIFDSLIESAAPDTTIAISTVDFGALVPQMRGPTWRQYHPPTHLNYPTRRSFQSYFPARGFTISYLASFGSYRPLAEYLKVLKLPLTEQLPRALRELPIYLNTYDTQLVIASRSHKP